MRPCPAVGQLSPSISIGGSKMRKPKQFCSAESGDAHASPHKEGTHRTHGCKRLELDFLRVRSGCVRGVCSAPRAIAGLPKGARRVRTRGEP